MTCNNTIEINVFNDYNIDASTFREFRNVILETDSLVTGSYALAAYLKQEGINVNYEPSDIDIFISANCEKKYIQLLTFIRSLGFENNNKHDDYTVHTDYYDSYCLSIESIDNVVSFSNNNGKIIQIIVVKSDNIKEYIKTNFDLSICITWWDPESNTFQTMMPKITKKCEMCIMRYNIPFSKLSERVEKYKNRGFKIVDNPCIKM